MKKIFTTSRTSNPAALAVPMLAALWLAAAAPVVAEQAPEPTPEQAIRETADTVLVVLRNEALNSVQKRDKLEELLVERADFETISKLVVARNWKRFSEAQQSEFTGLFKTYLSSTYGKNIDNYSNEEVEILGGREEARGDYTVLSKIVRASAEDILVDYRLRQRDGRWLIIDFKAEGISMVSNLRSQFQEILSQGGPDKLLEALRTKNAETVAESEG